MRVSSCAAEYPPAYYVVAVAPALADIERPLTVYAMRLVNALMFAALVASAFVSVLGTRVPKIASAGLLLALTPLAVSLGGVVNPNGPVDRRRDPAVDGRSRRRVALRRSRSTADW